MKMRHKLIVTGIACLSWGYHVYPKVIPQLQGKSGIITKAIDVYVMNHNGKLPPSLDDLAQFAYNCYDYGDQPLLKKEDLIDPWGEPFWYERKGGKYFFASSGPDKIMWTKDDIVEGSTNVYVQAWRGLQVQSGMDAGEAGEALPEWILTRPPPRPPLPPEEQARLNEEAAKEREMLMRRLEEARRAHRVFLRNAKVAGIALILAICAVTVWAVARKRARRK